MRFARHFDFVSLMKNGFEHHLLFTSNKISNQKVTQVGDFLVFQVMEKDYLAETKPDRNDPRS
jgi:hypothetical protein